MDIDINDNIDNSNNNNLNDNNTINNTNEISNNDEDIEMDNIFQKIINVYMELIIHHYLKKIKSLHAN